MAREPNIFRPRRVRGFLIMMMFVAGVKQRRTDVFVDGTFGMHRRTLLRVLWQGGLLGEMTDVLTGWDFGGDSGDDDSHL